MDSDTSGAELRFGAYQLLPEARILLRHGRPVEIGSRAFDLLHVLLRSRGAVVEHADIIRAVWPTTTVEASNLRVQVARLRAVLGEDGGLLKSIPGRGYLLAAEAAPERRPADQPLVSGEAEALLTRLNSVLDELWGIACDARMAAD